jgi:non-ribosomal peptide synthetase component F
MSLVKMMDSVEQLMQQYDQQGCLHEQFVKQARDTPEAVAVVTFDGKKVNSLHPRA